MLDSKALRLEMFKRSVSVPMLADAIGISIGSLYRRLNNEIVFTVREMQKCLEYLGLSDSERDAIFFNQESVLSDTFG